MAQQQFSPEAIQAALELERRGKLTDPQILRMRELRDSGIIPGGGGSGVSSNGRPAQSASQGNQAGPSRSIMQVIGDQLKEAGKGTLAGLTGVGRSMPGMDIANALIGTQGDISQGALQGKIPALADILPMIQQNLAQSKRIGNQVEGWNQPMAAIGRGVGTVGATSALGGLMGATAPAAEGAGWIGKLANSATNAVKMGGANLAVGQGQNPDLAAAPIQFGLGAGGSLAGDALSAASQGAKSVAPKVMNYALGTPASDFKLGRNLGQEALDRGVWGGAESLGKQATEGLKKFGDELDQAINLAGKDKVVNRGLVADKLEELKNFYHGVPGAEGDVAKIEALQKDFWQRGQMTLEDTQQMKKDIYKYAEKYYNNPAALHPATLEGQGTIAQGLKQLVEQNVPQAEDINKGLSFFTRLSDVANRPASQKLNPLDLRTILGGFSGGPIGAAATKIGTMPATSSALAMLMNQTGKAGMAAAPAGNTSASIINAIINMMMQQQGQNATPQR